MPNKTFYVSEDDLALLARAQELTGGSLSSAIISALRRLVEVESAKAEGFSEIKVKVGAGSGLTQRFLGTLLGSWANSTPNGYETIRVYATRRGAYAVHHARTETYVPTGPNAERSKKWSTGWRGWIGDWSSDQQWLHQPAEGTLKVAATLAELKDLLPPELYDSIAAAADRPTVEDLDI